MLCLHQGFNYGQLAVLLFKASSLLLLLFCFSRLSTNEPHNLTIFMANLVSSQAVFFKRELATPINQEARILDFVARNFEISLRRRGIVNGMSAQK